MIPDALALPKYDWKRTVVAVVEGSVTGGVVGLVDGVVGLVDGVVGLVDG